MNVQWSKLRESGRAATVGVLALAVALAFLIRFTGGRDSDFYPLVFLPVILAVVSCPFEAVVSVGVLLTFLDVAIIAGGGSSTAYSRHDAVRVLILNLMAVIGGIYSRHVQRERDKMRHLAGEQDSLMNAAQVVAAAPDLRSAMDATLRLARTIVPSAERGAIYLVDETRHCLVLAATTGVAGGEHLADKLGMRSRRTGWNPMEPMALYSPDAPGASDARLAELDARTRSVMCVGLRSLKVPVGMLYLGSTAPAAFSSEQIRYVEALCARASFALYRLKVEEGLQGLAYTDDLTNLPNHRSLRRHLADELKRAARHHRHVSLTMMDLDEFKSVNDRYGHPVGNQVLVRVAEVLRRNLRDTDIVARYGGEEFAVLCPETARSQAAEVAERMRAAIEATVFAAGPDAEVRLTLSAGVATYPEDAEDDSALVSAADLALYEAKRAGKNRVAVTGQPPPAPQPPRD